MPIKRMTANPSAPMRYRVGEAPAGADAPSSDSDSESESEVDERRKQPATQRGPAASGPSLQKIGGDFAARQAAAAASRAAEEAARRREAEEGFETASSDEGSGSEDDDDVEADDDSDSGSESESDYSSDSSGAQRRARFVVPTYISKAKRAATNTSDTKSNTVRSDEDDRQAKADAQLQAALDREAASRAAARRDWDAEDLDPAAEVDDTDGLDAAAEHAAWRLRELQRVRRERASLEEAEREREEVERRRGLAPEERAKEDAAFLAQQREGLEGRGKMGFMQRYHHKGAFFQAEDGAAGEDDEAVRRAMTRDVNGVSFMDDARDREGLPQYMQIRDMTKLGRKGRTRYKDLRSEDTGSFGFGLPGGGRRDRDRDERPYQDREGPSGANNTTVGERRRRHDEDGNRDEKRPRLDR